MRRSSAYTAFVCLLVLQGCGTLSTGHGWGQDATITPGWDKVGRAAVNALTSPAVWLPAAGAVALQYRDLDGRISDHASRQNPVFGSRDKASNASDTLEVIASAAYLASVAVTPSGAEPQDWMVNKTKGFCVGAAAIAATHQATSSLKSATQRQRPDGSNDASLPSAHAANTAVFTRLTTRNLEAIDMPEKARWAADAALYTLALGTSWARVEAQKHYPADVLAGMALGNFMAAFFYDTFMGLDSGVQPLVGIGPHTIHIAMHYVF